MPAWVFPPLPLPFSNLQGPINNVSSNPESSSEGVRQLSSQKEQGRKEDAHIQPSGCEVEAGYLADPEDDPRNMQRKRKSARGPKDEKVNFMNSLVRRYLHNQGYISSVPRFKATSLLLSPSPIIQRTLSAGVDSHAVDAFLYRQGPGPASENIQLFWNATMKHAWNKAAIHLMERQFLLYARKNHLSEIVAVFGEICLSPTNDFDEMLRKAIDIKHCISNKLDTQRSTIQTASRELTLAKHQSPHNFSTMLTQKRVSIAIRNRRYERRVGLYVRRGLIIQRMVADVTLDTKTQDLWKSIQVVYSYLVEEDMSSDETDVEAVFACPKIVRRIEVDWLSKEVSKILHFVDLHYQRQGNAPLPRIWRHIHTNKKNPPKPGLPLNLYSTSIQNNEDMLRSLQSKPAINLPLIPEFEPRIFPNNDGESEALNFNRDPSGSGISPRADTIPGSIDLTSLTRDTPMEDIQ